jgi:AcrR family transcriptional regulator
MSPAGTKGVPREEREQQILDVATKEFADRGYANASMADIASGAGVSKPLIYSYFGSRDGLHEACVRRAGDRLVAAVAEAQSVTGVGGRALATLSAIFHVLDGRTEIWRIIYDASLSSPSPAHHYRDALNGMGADGVTEVLGDDDGSGLNAEDRSLLLALWFSTVSTTISWWKRHPANTPDDMTERCVRLFAALG